MRAHEQLANMLQSNLIPHALLFCGPRGADKKKAAYQFALDLLKTKKSLENHPDAHLLFPEGKTELHTIQSIRKLAQDAALAPFESDWKIFIIHEADKMLPTSSNALLKTLEEPPPQTLILLISDHPERLLPTILSRCQTVTFSATEQENIDFATLTLLCENFPLDKISSFESECPEAVFETLILWYRDKLLLELDNLHLLHFPDHFEQLKNTPFIPFEKIEKTVNQIRLAYERGTKLSTCIEIFRLSFL